MDFADATSWIARANAERRVTDMIRTQLRQAVTLVAVAMLAACSADPTRNVSPLAGAAPDVALQVVGSTPTLLGARPIMQTLTRKAALPRDVRVEVTIGRDGGTIEVPQAGFVLTVPAGAVRADTRFAVTALKGRQVAYEFEPHGTVFLSSLEAVQDLRTTQHVLAIAPLKAVYFANRSLVNVSGVGTTVSEVIAGAVSLRQQSFAWPIDHFSGYIVAW